MEWQVLFHDDFEPEFYKLPEGFQDELLAYAKLLERFGFNLRRPHVDTLNGSRHANMKERCDSLKGSTVPLSRGTRPTDCLTAPTKEVRPRAAERRKGMLT